MQFPYSFWSKIQLQRDLISYYSFENNAALGSDTLNRHHFDNNGTQVNGKVNKGNELQSTSISIVGTTHSNDFNVKPNWTLAFWMKAVDIWEGTTDDIIITKGTGLGGWTLDANESTNSLIWRFFDGVGEISSVTSDQIFTLDTWWFVTMTHENKTFQITINANYDTRRFESTISDVTYVDNSSDFIITGPTTTSFIIDEVSLWHRTLNRTEVEKLYNGGAGITYPF